MNPKLNPEWEALEGKPQLVLLNCVQDQDKVIKVGQIWEKKLSNWRCHFCGEWLEICKCNLADI